MLFSLHALNKYTVHATDGEVGDVKDSLFDDTQWVIRYLVVETGRWLASRKVLVSPYSIGVPDAEHKILPANISQEQVRNSPLIDTDPPVSRQHEMEYSQYYGYPYYWGGDGLWGDGSSMPTLPPEGADPTRREDGPEKGNPHLRGAREVIGYQIHASDGDLGRVTDLLAEQESWAIRYLVISTGLWWGGNTVLIPPHWATGISWADETVSLDLSREKIQAASRFEGDPALTRAQERALYQHYARENYWDRTP